MLAGLLPGTLDVLVLRAVASRATHGYGVARWVRETTDGALTVEEGALYTALHRLQKAGLLRAEWKTSETGRRAKFYTLTPGGRRVLKEQTETFHRSATALFKALGAPRRGRSS
ncbi:MAG: PadR family transcriptional regulator [Vicinamibacterales bacterium]